MNNLDVDKLKLRVSLSGAVTTDTDDLQPSLRLASYKYILRWRGEFSVVFPFAKVQHF